MLGCRTLRSTLISRAKECTSSSQMLLLCITLTATGRESSSRATYTCHEASSVLRRRELALHQPQTERHARVPTDSNHKQLCAVLCYRAS